MKTNERGDPYTTGPVEDPRARAGAPPEQDKGDCPGCTAAVKEAGVIFDEETARGLDEYEVRRRWPRKTARCLQCGASTICYASYMHYIAGDW